VRGLERSPVMNIDHHPGNTVYGAVNWIDESAAACGEMAFTLIEALGVALTGDIATHLYLAILTDTGSFHFSHLSPRTYDIAGRCVAAGADPQWIARTHYDSNSLSRVRIFGAVMNDMVIVDEGRVAMIAITRQTMAALNGTNDDLEGLINFPLTVKDIEAVAFFKEIGDQQWRVSLRSKGSVDIGAIARQFNGGGHANAAGCSTTGDLDTIHKQFGALLADAVARKASRS
jgi:bifunctional oligoribonuclease and PAP phosphatase NrnA